MPSIQRKILNLRDDDEERCQDRKRIYFGNVLVPFCVERDGEAKDFYWRGKGLHPN
jgi:hypothetical protein